MWQISEEFTDYYSVPGGTRKQLVHLSVDKSIDAFNITYPIKWTGYVAGHPVEIIQLDTSSLTLDDFEFKEFPEQFVSIKRDVVKWIDEFLKRALS